MRANSDASRSASSAWVEAICTATRSPICPVRVCYPGLNDHPFVLGRATPGFLGRIYLTAAGGEHGSPFIRVAAGTEHRRGAETLRHALGAALETWYRVATTTALLGPHSGGAQRTCGHE